MGDILIDLGRFDEARHLLEEEIDRTEDPKILAELRYELGMVDFGQGAYRDAIGWLTDALAGPLESDLLEGAQLTRAVCLYELGRSTGDALTYDRAVSDLMELLERDPPDQIGGPAQETFGLSMLAMGKGEDAVEYFRHNVETARSSRERSLRFLGLAQVLYGMGRFDEAVEAGRVALEEEFEGKDEYGIRARAALVVGDALVELSRYEDAMEVLSDAAAVHADGPVGDRLLFSLGSAQFNAGDYEDAAETFASYAGRFPDATDVVLARYYLGHSYQAIGAYERAAEVFRELAGKHPTAAYAEESLFLAGENLYNLGNLQDARKVYQELVERYPGGTYAPEALYASAWCRLDLEDSLHALEEFEEVHTRFPKSPKAPDALITLGDYLYNAQEYDAAATPYRSVVDRYPGTPQATSASRLLRDLAEITAHRAYEKAMGLFDAGQYRDAIRSFEETIEQYPDTRTEMAARCNIGVSYEHLREWRKAVEVYDQMLEHIEDDPDYADARAFASEHKEWVVRYRL